MTHLPFIEQWPSLAVFAEDLHVAYGTAKAMKRRGVIPSQYWEAVVLSACVRGLAGISYEALATSIARRIHSPASSSAGDDAGAPVTPPAQSGAPAANSDSHAIKGACETGGQLRPETALLPIIHSKSPEVLPSGETGAQFMGMGCAPPSACGEVVR